MVVDVGEVVVVVRGLALVIVGVVSGVAEEEEDDDDALDEGT